MRWSYLVGFIVLLLLFVILQVALFTFAGASEPIPTSIGFDTYAVQLSAGVWLSGDVLPLRRWYRVNTGDAVLLLCAAEYTSDYRTVLVEPGASSAECDGQ